MIDCVYYNEFVRCYRNGVVERLFKRKGWKLVEHNGNSHGYNNIRINGKMIFRHRLIAYCFLGLDDIVGEKNKSNSIDHIDGNKLNNSVSNLRVVNHIQNHQNRTTAKGYSWHKQHNKYHAEIRVDYKLIHLGYFDTQEEARNVYLKAKEKYHPFGSII